MRPARRPANGGEAAWRSKAGQDGAFDLDISIHRLI